MATVVIGTAIIVAVVVYWVISYLAEKLKPKPSYVSDMEHELGNAIAEVDASMDMLRTEVSKVIAREIPKAVKAGKNSITIELYTSKPEHIVGEAGLLITYNQLSVLAYHRLDSKWAKSKLIDPSLAKYIYIASLDVNKPLHEIERADLHLILNEV